jgi:hypothetical protein
MGTRHQVENVSSDKVVVLVIDGFNSIEENSFFHKGKDVPVICKLWKVLPIKDGVSSTEPTSDHSSLSNVERCIQNISGSLFEKHSNLEIVSACHFRLKDS